MANTQKGEVSLDVGGTSYTLKQSFNGMIEAEDASEAVFGRRMKWDEITDGVNSGELRELRLFLYGLLRKCHPDLTLEAVGDLVDDSGGLDNLASKMQAATSAGAPDPADMKDLGVDKKRPRKALVNGTGGRSTSPHVASA